MKSVVRHVDDHGKHYICLMFCCPACAESLGGDGIHMLPVNSPNTSPSWEWDWNLERPTLSPSILTTTSKGICHSYLRDGVFEYLNDCAHSMAGQKVELPDLPTWAYKEAEANQQKEMKDESN